MIASPRRPSNSTNVRYQRYSCNDLFGSHQIQRDGACLQHALLRWVSCPLKTIVLDTNRIQGSLGGEAIDTVLSRSEAVEKLNFTKGSLQVTAPIPQRLKNSVDRVMRSFLDSAVVLVPNLEDIAKEQIAITTTTTTLLVRRGNYANPCMALLTMYNVYIVMRYFEIAGIPQIIWLDGHAHGDLDAVWQHLFQTTPIHVKQYQKDIQQQQQLVENAIVLNTMSAIGDEGFGRYEWSKNNNSTANNTNCSSESNSTLIAFRDFVLDRYEISRKTKTTQQSVLTLLVRQNYVAHPRSNGVTDRTLANVEDDIAYLQSLYPQDTIQVISFEGLDFQRQLEYITQTDVFVSVHGAGNIHVLFLPDHATFVEYFPKGYDRRRRFRFLAACLNINYHAKVAWIVEQRLDDGTGAPPKVSVRLRPLTATEQSNDSWD